MARYVDGYVLPLKKNKVAEYKKIATKAGKVWMECGALEYRECAGDDLDVKFGLPFPKALKIKPDETVVFAWIVFKSRKHRDQVNAKVMKHPSMQEQPQCPFDPKKMLYGGFTVLVDL
jgi:uncharacterized protein YbaA (DUF1428 family)